MINILRSNYKQLFDVNEKKMINVNQLFNFMLGMFEYKGMPDTFDTRFFERYLLTNGMAAAVEKDGKWYASFGSLAGPINEYQYGTTFVFANPVFSGERSIYAPDCSICWNNPTMTPEFYLASIADTMSELECSVDTLINYTRATKGIIARNDKVFEQLKTFFSNLRKGKPFVMLSKNVLDDVIEGKDVKDVLELDLTNPDLSNQFQYLINAHDSILRWFMNWYGHSQANSNKLAQQSVSEVDNANSASLVIPTLMLNERKKFIEDFNKKSGLNASVDFSELWKNEVKETMIDDAPEDDKKGDDEDVEQKESED